MKFNTSYIELATIDKTHVLFMCADGSERLFKLPDDCVGNHYMIDQVLGVAKYLPWSCVDQILKLVNACIRGQFTPVNLRTYLCDLSKS